MVRAEAVIDLDAITANLARVRALAGSAQIMAVVKADAYGHGIGAIASTARAFGAEWLGVALPSEALSLRSLGDSGPILAWLWTPGDPDIDACIAQGVDLGISSTWALEQVVASARAQGLRARVQVKLDTGLSRNGLSLAQWPSLIDALGRSSADGLVEVAAVWSHLADGDAPGAATVGAQRDAFVSAVELARRAGLDPGLLHLSNSGALWAFPDCRFDLVRTGIAMYGLAPAPALGTSRELGLVPAMTLRAELAHVKQIAAGTSVSYGSTWTSQQSSTVGLVPLGYADGIPRASGGRVEVAVEGARYPAVGRTAMDQFVIDLGPASLARAGDDVVLFGSGAQGELTADEWAERIDTIGYEVVTRIGSRVPRRYTGGSASAAGDDGRDES